MSELDWLPLPTHVCVCVVAVVEAVAVVEVLERREDGEMGLMEVGERRVCESVRV